MYHMIWAIYNKIKVCFALSLWCKSGFNSWLGLKFLLKLYYDFSYICNINHIRINCKKRIYIRKKIGYECSIYV